jgi:hypothetical protein
MRQTRTQDTQVNVRMRQDQRDLLEAATSVIVPGVQVPLGPWMLATCLIEASRLIDTATRIGQAPRLLDRTQSDPPEDQRDDKPNPKRKPRLTGKAVTDSGGTTTFTKYNADRKAEWEALEKYIQDVHAVAEGWTHKMPPLPDVVHYSVADRVLEWKGLTAEGGRRVRRRGRRLAAEQIVWMHRDPSRRGPYPGGGPQPALAA